MALRGSYTVTALDAGFWLLVPDTHEVDERPPREHGVELPVGLEAELAVVGDAPEHRAA